MRKVIHIFIFWLVIIAITLLPLSISRVGVGLYFFPQIEIAVTYFLSIYTNIYPIKLFLYGLLIDVAYGTKIGFSAFILLVINKIICRFKSNLSRQDLKYLLLYFAFTYTTVSIFKYIVFVFESGLYLGPNIAYILTNIVVNIAFYPLIHFGMRNSPYINSLNVKL